ncbi:hypothetical protein [uncultured Maribacter sp.]|uniref:hypothetical protein n=1 Tax=uncultured Maribacter sp. TaxID=431308 RepID=UPI0030DB4C97|tara:strand:+ start:10367 stop:10948 length:582 start_codon:yes stop_codon:yes gene_type:complete
MINSTTSSSFKEPNSEHITISLWLDSYNEMFSDFDPRPYSKRTVSDDFILQIRKVAKNRYRKKMTLKILLAESVRNKQDEKVISDHIHNYFQKNHEKLLKEKRNTNRKGFLFTTVGILLMIIASYISFLKSESYYTHVLLILFEPAGWFMFWTGLDIIVNYSGRKRKEIDFYTHMVRTEIEFSTYDEESNKLI